MTFPLWRQARPPPPSCHRCWWEKLNSVNHTAAEVAATPSAARSVWATPLYRAATVALFLSGLGTSAAAPQITLFLVNDLHVSLTTAGLFYLTNITAPLAGYLIGARSDRSGKRLGLFRWCALAGFVGGVAMALADPGWMSFVIRAVLLTVRRGPRRPAGDREPRGRRGHLHRTDGVDGRMGRRPGPWLDPGDRRRFARDACGYRLVRPRAARPHGLRAHPPGPARRAHRIRVRSAGRAPRPTPEASGDA